MADKPAPRQVLFDTVFAVLFGLFVAAGTHGAAQGQETLERADLSWFAYVLVGASAAALVVRRIWPFVALGGTVAALVVYLSLQYAYGPIFFAVGVAMYTVGEREPVRRSLLAAVLGTAAVLVPDLLTADTHDWVGGPTFLIASRIGLFVVPWLVGRLVRQRREQVAQTREEGARQAADAERLAVAREVHDVVGHGLAVINMQAGIALHVLSRRPERAAEALQAIKKTSKDALDELRGTLAVFRSPDEEARRPAPGLSMVDALAAAVADSGLQVDLSVRGDHVHLPSSVDLAGYRIVQESLTNVLRHAGRPVTARVDIVYGPFAVDVSIDDDGVKQSHTGSGGYGIVGMRERAAAVGGTLEAGPRPEGGFSVHARLPFGDG